MFKIGTFADWFGVGLIEGIKQSRGLEAQGVQVYAWNELSPDKATSMFLGEVAKTASDYQQEIVALCGELGGHGLEIMADNSAKIEYLKKIVDMAYFLECRVVTTHIGIIPEDSTSDKYKYMQEACNQIGEYANRKSIGIAIETGPEKIVTLKKFVDGCIGIGINYDPANLVMVTRDDEVAGVLAAKNSILHTHAKDGVCYQTIEPKVAYDIFADGGIEELSKLTEYFEEQPLGKGQVRWEEYLAALVEVGYTGYLTIEREVKEDAVKDIGNAVKFLKEKIANLENRLGVKNE